MYNYFFYVLLAIGSMSGFAGGWIMQGVAAQVDERQFNNGALLMLLQDILIALFFLREWAEIAVFIVIIFIMPAAGFLAAQSKQVPQEKKKPLK